MNKLGYLLVGGVLLVIAVVAGGWYVLSTYPLFTSPDTAPTTLETNETEKTIVDTGDYYTISATYPTVITLEDGTRNESAVAALSAYISDEIATFKRESGLETLTPEDVEVQGLGDERKYALGITYKTHESPATVSYVFSIFADTLGAHPNGYYRTFTFSKKTGAELTLADIFSADSAYLDYLSTTARSALTTQIAKASQVEVSEVDTSYIESGTEPKKESFQWFYLTDTELVLIFPPYQVGPWALGTQLVSLPKKDISLLRAEYQ